MMPLLHGNFCRSQRVMGLNLSRCTKANQRTTCLFIAKVSSLMEKAPQ